MLVTLIYRTFKLSEVENLASIHKKIPRTEFLPLVRSVVVMKLVFQESTRHARRPLSTSAFVSTACNTKGLSQKSANAECKCRVQGTVRGLPATFGCLSSLQCLCQYFTSVVLIRMLRSWCFSLLITVLFS